MPEQLATSQPEAASDRDGDTLRQQSERGVILRRLRRNHRQVRIHAGEQSADVFAHALPLIRAL